jgi:hypothetical protein
MQPSDQDPMAQGHLLRFATQGTSGRPCSAEKKRATAGELTGDRRVVDGGSRVVWERRGLVLGQLDGLSSFLPASGGSSLYAASGSRS